MTEPSAGLDPDCRRVLDDFAAHGGHPLGAADLAAARQSFALTTRRYAPPPSSCDTLDFTIPADLGPMAARRYRRPGAAAGARPAVVFLHGGGWVFGDLESHDPLCRGILRHADWDVVALDFRLAPEHRFPAPVQDCGQALDWIFDNAGTLGIDPARIALAGDSSGGHIAAVLAQRLAGRRKLAAQVLIYPALSFYGDSESMAALGEGHLITRDSLERSRQAYAGAGYDPADPGLSPGLAPLPEGMPASLILAAEFDPLRDEAMDYHRRLQAAGVDSSYVCASGMLHGFLRMGGWIGRAEEGFREIGRFLDRRAG